MSIVHQTVVTMHYSALRFRRSKVFRQAKGSQRRHSAAVAADINTTPDRQRPQ